MTPLVSVILPTHNRFDQMKEALASIQNQTYQNVEIIVILDGYHEASHKFLEQKKAESLNITFTVNESPKGGAEVRNIGILRSKGKYLAFLDDDDIWYHTKLAKQIYFLENNTSYTIAGCYHQKIDGQSKSLFKPKKSTLTSEDLKYENYLGSFSFCTVRKKDVHGIIIPKSLTSCQDWYFWLVILEQSAKKAKIIPEVLVQYDSSDKKSITNNFNGRVDGYFLFYKFINEKLNSSQSAFHMYKHAKIDYVSGKNRLWSYFRMVTSLLRSCYFIDYKLHLKELFFIIK